tara:strand:+ start:37 stop:267 length:231 start_codon:yes stop_codon:yes gene_type:complete
MNTITLPNGSKQHTLPKWIGIQAKGDPMIKTKWRRTDIEYFDINGYTQTRNHMGSITCTCKGYYFRKNCRHIKEIA